MNKKFSKEELLKAADSGLTDLSCKQIKKLIQKESQKNYEDINTDFIDLCFDVLEMKQKDKSSKMSNIKISSKKNSAKKTLIVAAVFMVFIATTLTVSAQFNLNIPQKIVQLINGNAEIDYNLENADTTADEYALLNSDLAKKLADYGITPVTFPEEMINENCNIYKIEKRTVDETISKDIYMYFEYDGCYGNLSITQLAENLDWVGKQSVMDVVSGQKIQVNGMDILIFEQKDSCIIQYKDNLTEYNIYIESNLDTALKLAESIK